MIPREILKQVRLLEITTRGLVNDVFSGEYHSVFKGRGMSFAEVREYRYGDDIRGIDWNVTARTGSPHVKVFEEERELTLMLVVDVSASAHFGTRARMKSELAAELCGVLAFSAIKNNDKVGLILFSDRIEHFVPPRKGRRHALRVLRELLYRPAEGTGTDIAGALEYLARVTRRRAVAFLVSDFLAEGYERALSVAARRHDLVAVRVGDAREAAIPAMGFVEFEDPETGRRVVVNTSGRAFRERFGEGRAAARARVDEVFRRSKVDSIEVTTGVPYERALRRFFEERGRRVR
ncbi:MAG: DUF58 domain-containing protein [Gemmatimonadetes bacterium]|nr:DUF58 domain-containing protein [Gemmatimonadota bacterium]MCY3677445.1 DUF58 domain-containing protein [Gemmatimonadota bacterium]MYE94866.1 DUF58 domain-containing protein [Gemmatimonadota bacterium]